MATRIDYTKIGGGALRAMLGLEKYLAESSIKSRMHWKDAGAAGESEQRLYGLSAWREAPYYSERERAALAWTEELTLIAEHHVPDELYAQCAGNSVSRRLSISLSPWRHQFLESNHHRLSRRAGDLPAAGAFVNSDLRSTEYSPAATIEFHPSGSGVIFGSGAGMLGPAE